MVTFTKNRLSVHYAWFSHGGSQICKHVYIPGSREGQILLFHTAENASGAKRGPSLLHFAVETTSAMKRGPSDPKFAAKRGPLPPQRNEGHQRRISPRTVNASMANHPFSSTCSKFGSRAISKVKRYDEYIGRDLAMIVTTLTVHLGNGVQKSS